MRMHMHMLMHMLMHASMYLGGERCLLLQPRAVNQSGAPHGVRERERVTVRERKRSVLLRRVVCVWMCAAARVRVLELPVRADERVRLLFSVLASGLESCVDHLRSQWRDSPASMHTACVHMHMICIT